MLRRRAPAAARSAVSPHAHRPARALIPDAPDAGLALFRIESAEVQFAHATACTVLVRSLGGRGVMGASEGQAASSTAEVVSFNRGEPRGMRAVGDDMLPLPVTISPRPGAR